ncbi:MAG TPA: STAS domain-containing protein [Xanthomonadaceae bacterium]|nr:STAS domain-containing protein [Xanthomonadaceae bacterium]
MGAPGNASVRRDGGTLTFEGPLELAAAPALWADALPLLDGADAVDLGAVAHVDSAGLALLAELQSRAGGCLVVRGEPDGLPGLRAAYRLDASLLPA